jgi:TolB protein
MKKLFFILFVSSVCFSIFTKAFAEGELTIVAVGEATLEKDKMVIQDAYLQGALSGAQKTAAKDIVLLLRNDFSFYQKKFFLTEAAANNSASRPVTNYDYWTSKGVRYLGTATVEKTIEGLKVNLIFEDIKSRKQIFNETQNFSLVTLRKVGHRLADSAYLKMTGKNSMFNSKIVFVSDRNSRNGRMIKEVYLMDFDGRNVNQLTSHGGITMSPAMSPDGKYLLYSLLPAPDSKKRNNNLYLMDVATKETRIISEKDGINSGAIFLPDGKSIALTLTHSGNAEIVHMNLETKALRKITNHFASDVDPSVNQDGTLMTFLSDRAGKAMIYTLDPRGEEKSVTRISYVGQFNATPRFSPDGKDIVFASWVDNSFDLYHISSTGEGLQRLTKDFGSNEDPTYSSDGEFILFSSQRVISRTKADQNLYIMDRDGGILGAVTAKFGNCLSPRWYNFL